MVVGRRLIGVVFYSPRHHRENKIRFFNPTRPPSMARRHPRKTFHAAVPCRVRRGREGADDSPYIPWFNVDL